MYVGTGERHAQLTFVARIYSKHELVFSDFLAPSLAWTDARRARTRSYGQLRRPPSLPWDMTSKAAAADGKRGREGEWPNFYFQLAPQKGKLLHAPQEERIELS